MWCGVVRTAASPPPTPVGAAAAAVETCRPSTRGDVRATTADRTSRASIDRVEGREPWRDAVVGTASVASTWRMSDERYVITRRTGPGARRHALLTGDARPEWKTMRRDQWSRARCTTSGPTWTSGIRESAHALFFLRQGIKPLLSILTNYLYSVFWCIFTVCLFSFFSFSLYCVYDLCNKYIPVQVTGKSHLPLCVQCEVKPSSLTYSAIRYNNIILWFVH